jgi:hypothetical protein
MHKQREPWWNNIDRGELIRSLECSLATLPMSHLVANQEELGEEDDEFNLRSIFAHTLKFFTHCKILRHGASGVISPPKKGVLRIFIALKNPSPRQGLNLQTLGPMANMLTITPSRLSSSILKQILHK